MKPPFKLLFILILLTANSVSFAQPHIYPIGLAVSDQVHLDVLPMYMQKEHSRLVNNMHNEMQAVLTDLNRCKTYNWKSSYQEGSFFFKGIQSVDYVVHVILNRSSRIYRNKILYQYQEDFFDFNIGNPGDGNSYQILSQPAISMQIKIELIRQPDNKIIWSAIHDSTALIPYNTQTFLFNPAKYPGTNHPQLIKTYMADIVRMRMSNREVDNQLEVSDFWFMSQAQDDLATAKALIKGLTSSLFSDIDNNLPIAGRIQNLLPKQQEKSKALFSLNIGKQDGIVPKLKMDVWRTIAQKQKVAKIEIIAVDSTTSIAKLRKLDKKIRKRGEGIQPGDLVISHKRRSNRKRPNP